MSYYSQKDLDVSTETDRAVIAELFQRHAPALFAYLRRHISSREDAEDLLLEAFAAALEQPRFVALSEEQQRQWLWRVIRNKTVDTYRRKLRRPSTTLELVSEELFVDDAQLPEHAALRQEDYARLYVSLQKLSPLQREAVRLRFANNLRCAEIALVLGRSESAVRMLLSRALNLLRALYKEE